MMAVQQPPHSGSNGEQAGSGWRGRAPQGVAAPSHRWQGGGSALPDKSPQPRATWAHVRLYGVLVGFMGLLGLLLFNLLAVPLRTPVIVLTAQAYETPLPPNSWVAEDLAGLQTLDGQTLDVYPISMDGSFHQSLQQLEETLAQIGRRRPSNLIVYVSAYGAVNGDQVPCLIPPTSSPLSSSTWLPIESLLKTLQDEATLADCQKLVVFDGPRQVANWQLGIAINTFASRLSELFARRQDTNLAIIDCTGHGQASWSSPVWRRSVFSYYFEVALRGAADHKVEGGNGDRTISLQELFRFVNQRVHHWAKQQRDAEQTPVLLAGSEVDFSLATAVSRRSQRSLSSARTRVAQSSANNQKRVTEGELESVWKTWHELVASCQLTRYAPWQRAEMERRILGLEQMVDSGMAYESTTQQTLRDVQQALEQLKKHAAAIREHQRSLVHCWSTRSDRPLRLPRIVAHDLSMAEFLGQLDAARADSLREETEQLLLAADEARLHQGLKQLVAAPVAADLGTYRSEDLAEIYHLELMSRFRVPPLWQGHDGLAQVWSCGRKSDRLAVPYDAGLDTVGDIRAHAWIRHTLAQGDVLRRAAQDQLLMGPAASGDEVLKQCHEADAAYDRAVSMYQELSRALDLCDNAWAELPHLLAWYVHPLNITDRKMQSQYDSHFTPLLREIDKLSRLLARADTDQVSVEATLTELRAVAKALGCDRPDSHGLWQTIQEELKHQYVELHQAPADPVNVRRIDGLLQLPFLPSADRTLLRAHRDKIVAELHQSLMQTRSHSGSIAPAPTTTPVAAHDYAEWWTSTVTDPWRSLFIDFPTGDEADEHDRLPSRGADRNAQLELAGEQLRLVLLHGVRPNSEKTVGTEPSGRSAESYRLAEQRIRVLLPLATGSDSPEIIDQRLRRELQQWLVWRCGRAVDDFWGPTVSDSTPFFFKEGLHYLQAAHAVWPVPEFEKLRSELESTARQAAKLLTIVPDGPALLPGARQSFATPVRIRRAVRSTHESGPEATGAVALLIKEDGQAGGVDNCTFVHVSSAGAAKAGFRFDELSPDSAFQVAGQVTGQDAHSRLQLLAMYRGHEYTARFELRDLQGIRIVARPDGSRRARVCVRDASTDYGSLIVLLDGSQSMSESVNTAGDKAKIDVARASIHEMLAEIAERTPMRCGLWVYGHRIGWSVEEPNRRLVQQQFSDRIPDGLLPSRDVQQLLPLGSHDESRMAVALEQLDAVVGWGQSPHYTALERALSSFGTYDKGDETVRAVVVLTDGGRFAANAGKSPREEEMSWDEFIRSVSDHGIPIHFLVAGTVTGADRGALQEIAQMSRGSVRACEDGRSLVNSFARVPDRRRYRLHEVDSHDSSIDPADPAAQSVALNQSAFVDMQETHVRTMAVALGQATQPLVIRRGEYVDLAYDAKNGRFLTPAYRREMARSVSLQSSRASDRAGPTCLVHRPAASAGQVTFAVSWQEPDRRYQPRPAETWLEITPLSSSGQISGPTYIYYDNIFQNSAPVPLLECPASGWPNQASRAEIRIWCNDRATAPILVKPLAEVLADAARTVPVVAGISCSIAIHTDEDGEKNVRVDVTEHYDQSVTRSGQLKVDIELAAALPEKIVRYFDAEQRTAVHSFFYPASLSDALRREAQLSVRTRDAIHATAWQTPVEPPLVIDVPDAGEFIQWSRVAPTSR